MNRAARVRVTSKVYGKLAINPREDETHSQVPMHVFGRSRPWRHACMDVCAEYLYVIFLLDCDAASSCWTAAGR